MTKTEKLEAISELLPDFKVESGGEDLFIATFSTSNRVISWLEEEKCLELIKKAGGNFIEKECEVGTCVFKFKLPDVLQ